MNQPPFKPILLDLLHQARLAQDAFVQVLSPAERAAIGSPAHWSAKDNVAHITFWRQRLVLKLQAVQRHETPAGSDDFEQLNPIVFERQQHRSWSEVLAESDQAYTELVALTDQFTEEDLTAFNRFEWIPDGWPLYTAFMGSCYEHAQQHFAEYYLDRHDFPHALQCYDAWAGRVVQTEAPDFLKGYVLYNLACFYATHAELEKASTTLRQACSLHPPLEELARTDPDLVTLYSNRPETYP